MNIDKYNSVLKKVEYARVSNIPEISVIVIAHKYKPELVKCLLELYGQKKINHETIFVNNGEDRMEFDSKTDVIDQTCDKYIELKENTGAYIARNIGACFAQGQILVFVDDDGIPANDTFLYEFKKAFETYEMIACRGRCVSQTGIVPPFYDWGDKPFPAYPTLEGCSAFDRNAFFEVGGWCDDIQFGGGGFEISCKLIKKSPEYYKQLYIPGPILVHEYSKDEETLAAKKERQAKGRAVWQAKHPDWKQIHRRWASYAHKPELVVYRNIAAMASTESLRKKIRKALKGLTFKKNRKNMYTVFGGEQKIVRAMSKAGFDVYYRRMTEPKAIECRLKDKKIIIEIIKNR